MGPVEILGYGAFLAATYHFALYPMSIILASRWLGSKPRTDLVERELPSVTLIIAAFNEERVIVDKIKNSLQIDYPAQLFRIIVVADGSTDATAEKVRQFADPRVECMFDPVRRGKGSALNRAVASSRSDVLVLSDANNHYSRDSVRLLVGALQGPGVGGVSGAKRIVESRERAASTGDGLYWRYESRLKEAESALCGTVTGDGEIFALRRADYTPIPANVVNDDMFLSIRLVERGLKLIYVPVATALEEASITLLEDYRTKVRMIAGGLQNLRQDWRAIMSNRAFALKFFSHKVLRWFMPAILAALLLTSALAPLHSLLFKIFWLQLALYCLAALGALAERCGLRLMILYVPYYFVVMNAAAAAGILRFLCGGQSSLWSKAER